MHAESSSFLEAWKLWAVPGSIIQIRAERNLLFRPNVTSRPFWLYLEDAESTHPVVGPARLLIVSAVFRCRRRFAHRDRNLKIPLLDCHADVIERARGRLLQPPEEEGGPFVVDLGFPLLVDQLDRCPEIQRSHAGDLIELDLVAPMRAYILD